MTQVNTPSKGMIHFRVEKAYSDLQHLFYILFMCPDKFMNETHLESYSNQSVNETKDSRKGRYRVE